MKERIKALALQAGDEADVKDLHEDIARLTNEAYEREKDAARYRWLRAKHWHDGGLCVVTNAKETVRLGTDCPSHERLDAAIDAAREGKNDCKRTGA